MLEKVFRYTIRMEVIVYNSHESTFIVIEQTSDKNIIIWIEF